MRDLPPAIIHVLRHFEPLFSECVWEWAKILLVGAILMPGKRTVTSALWVMGLSQEWQFQNFHRVLNRTTWSSRTQVLCRAHGFSWASLRPCEGQSRDLGLPVPCVMLSTAQVKASW